MERRSKSAKGQNTKLPNYKKLQITNYKNKILTIKLTNLIIKNILNNIVQ